ncbi:hypothetical protein WA158_001266 [Blastocystis sp. Blastoise]
MITLLYSVVSYLIIAGIYAYYRNQYTDLLDVVTRMTDSTASLIALCNCGLVTFFLILKLFQLIYIGKMNDQEKENFNSSLKKELGRLMIIFMLMTRSLSVVYVFPIALCIFNKYMISMLYCRVETFGMIRVSYFSLFRTLVFGQFILWFNLIFIYGNCLKYSIYMDDIDTMELFFLNQYFLYFVEGFFLCLNILLIALNYMNVVSIHNVSFVSLLFKCSEKAIILFVYIYMLLTSIGSYSELLAYPQMEIMFTFSELNNYRNKISVYMTLRNRIQTAFPTATEAQIQNDNMCVICRDDMIAEEAIVLPCGHIFHVDCIKTWILEHSTCPTCRFNLLDPLTNNAAPRHNMNPPNPPADANPLPPPLPDNAPIPPPLPASPSNNMDTTLPTPSPSSSSHPQQSIHSMTGRDIPYNNTDSLYQYTSEDEPFLKPLSPTTAVEQLNKISDEELEKILRTMSPDEYIIRMKLLMNYYQKYNEYVVQYDQYYRDYLEAYYSYLIDYLSFFNKDLDNLPDEPCTDLPAPIPFSFTPSTSNPFANNPLPTAQSLKNHSSKSPSPPPLSTIFNNQSIPSMNNFDGNTKPSQSTTLSSIDNNNNNDVIPINSTTISPSLSFTNNTNISSPMYPMNITTLDKLKEEQNTKESQSKQLNTSFEKSTISCSNTSIPSMSSPSLISGIQSSPTLIKSSQSHNTISTTNNNTIPTNTTVIPVNDNNTSTSPSSTTIATTNILGKSLSMSISSSQHPILHSSLSTPPNTSFVDKYKQAQQAYQAKTSSTPNLTRTPSISLSTSISPLPTASSPNDILRTSSSTISESAEIRMKRLQYLDSKALNVQKGLTEKKETDNSKDSE